MSILDRPALGPSSAPKPKAPRGINILGWITTAAIFSATIGLVVSWFV